MQWYGAHLIKYLKYKDNIQNGYVIYENIVLVSAETPGEALLEAEKYGKSEEVDTTIGPNDRPAEWIFAGVRYVMPCSNVNELSETSLVHGTKITSRFLQVESEADIEKLVEEEEVKVKLLGFDS